MFFFVLSGWTGDGAFSAEAAAQPILSVLDPAGACFMNEVIKAGQDGDYKVEIGAGIYVRSRTPSYKGFIECPVRKMVPAANAR